MLRVVTVKGHHNSFQEPRAGRHNRRSGPQQKPAAPQQGGGCSLELCRIFGFFFWVLACSPWHMMLAFSQKTKDQRKLLSSELWCVVVAIEA